MKLIYNSSYIRAKSPLEFDILKSCGIAEILDKMNSDNDYTLVLIQHSENAIHIDITRTEDVKDEYWVALDLMIHCIGIACASPNHQLYGWAVNYQDKTKLAEFVEDFKKILSEILGYNP